MNRFCTILCLAIAIAFALPAHAASKQKPTRPKSTKSEATCIYKGFIVLDAATGNVLVEDNADVVTPPASMTKLMTFAVISDKLQRGELTLETPIRIDASDSRMGGTQVYLDPRETFSVEELIHAIMIQSANDASHALARASAGAVPIFVEQMNAKAKEIGMTRTIFRTPHGLTSKSQRITEGDLTTPRDFAILCRYLVQRTDVLKYSSVRERDFAPERAKGPIHMENHNRLIGRVIGVDGLKTGYTENAGYCLSATAERNGRRVVAVIMGCFGPKGEKDYGRSRDQKMIELLERGFAALNAGPTPAVAPTVSKPAAPAPTLILKPATTAKPTVSKPTPTAKPAPVVGPAPSPVSPVSATSVEESPVQAAASSVSPAANSTEAAPPSVKFELPPKKK
ncbi:MAG: D-alanyl-D-alanine carboxypeptidase [Verrucomicrobia bacterium]|nr:D-alanyl-D-alanine carboxypeptidase [Verrucomicrobiota bacterium]